MERFHHQQVSRVEIMGVHFDRLTERETTDHILSRLDLGHGGWLVTPNVDILRQLVADEDLRRLVARADLRVADGVPVVWASKVQRDPLPERVAGSALIWTLTAEAARAGRSIFLLGDMPGVGEVAAERLTAVSPELDVRGVYSPPWGFEQSEQELEEIVERLGECAPDIVYCGFGFPKQERLMAYLAPRLPKIWFIGCGGSIGMAAGVFTRAPEWVQRAGLEWLHRLALEPRRLFRRYILEDIPFACSLAAASVRRRWQPLSAPAVIDLREPNVVALSSATGPSLRQLHERVRLALPGKSDDRRAPLGGTGVVVALEHALDLTDEVVASGRYAHEAVETG